MHFRPLLVQLSPTSSRETDSQNHKQINLAEMDEVMHCNVSTGYNDIKSKQVEDCPGSEEIQEHKQFKLLRMTFKIAKYYVIKVKSLLQTAFVKEVE